MALWTTVNTLVLPQRVETTVPEHVQGSALGFVGLIGIGIAALVQPIAGRVTDAAPFHDRRGPFITAGTAGAIIGLVLFGWAPGFAFLVLGYVALQLAANVAQAAFQALIPDLISEQQRGAASGVKNALTVAGAALGLLGARLLQSLQAGTGWILAYLAVLLGASAVLTAIWVPAIPPIPPEERSGGVAAAIHPAALWASFWGIWRAQATYRVAVTAQFLFLLGTYPAQRFLWLFLSDRFGRGVAERASIGLALAIVLAAVAAAFAGVISDTTGRTPVLVASAIWAAVGLGLLGFAPNLVVVAVAGALIAAGTGAFQAVNWALLSDTVPKAQAASAFGVANIATAGAGAVAGIFGPVVDLMDALMPAGTFQLTFGLAALITLASLSPFRHDPGAKR
jgi:MFS family permease